MGQQSSKDSLLYKYACSGKIGKIKALRAKGAGLEWIDEEGRTPLILACMHSKKYNVAKTLIELGANVNASCPGSQGGTPLHHAAERGLEKTVKLLLSNGANALLVNDNSQTPLHVARAKQHRKVVRAIESHICLFSGWLREPFGPVILGVLAPTLLSRKVWVVVLPFASNNLAQPFKLELAIYSGPKDSQPRTLVSLWNANMEGVKFVQSDHAVIISDTPNKLRIKLEPANETDKQQLHHFCNACKGIPQLPASSVPIRTQAPVVQATVPSSAEDLALARGINVSIQLTMESRSPRFDANPISGASAFSRIESGWTRNHNELQEVCSSGYPILSSQNHIETPSSLPSAPPSSLPSAPPIENAVLDGSASSSCVICLDAPVEGACIPCGHMVGCMSCLNEIEGKNWGCPVCRTKINQVMRLYAV